VGERSRVSLTAHDPLLVMKAVLRLLMTYVLFFLKDREYLQGFHSALAEVLEAHCRPCFDLGRVDTVDVVHVQLAELK